MANNPKKNASKSIDMLRKQVDDLYSSTYYTSDNSEEMSSQVTDRLDDAIRKSTQGDDEFQNISNTSRLFMKVMKGSNVGNSATNKLAKSFGSGGLDDISTMFQNPDIISSIMDSYSKTKWITELDNEFDMICKYMPKLKDALDIKRDAVLCSDTYTKRFLNVRAKGENPSSDKNSAIQNNIEEMMRKYDLADRAEQWYDDTSKYGEAFVYCVPYNVALEELLKRKNSTSSTYMQELGLTSKDLKDYLPKGHSGTASAYVSESGDIGIKITLDTSKVLKEAVQENLSIRKAIESNKFRSLSESFSINETGESFTSHLNKSGKDTVVKFDNTIDNEIEWEDDDKTASSGLVDINKDKKTKLNVNGAVVKTIKHDKIIPIYVDDTMFGAYYIRSRQLTDIGLNATGNIKGYNSISGMFNNGPIGTNISNDEDTANQNDLLLRRLSAEISSRIDKAFINANVDLKKEIYLMLKFNDRYNQTPGNGFDMDILFIPADDIHHLKFREDPETHRGVSDLWDALVPAKQWITLNLTSILGWTTRGFDRRVYYVKQSLDTNTAQSLLNVISTIKKGNFGVRQMESVNNILNIVGRFNDFVIPIGPSGDAPIQFDTMPGQQFDFPDQLLTNLEESAVNSTGVPLEIVNSSTGMDFAVRYTMTNAKLLRNVLKRQLKVEDFLSDIFTKIYRFEFNDNIELEVTLPPPAFLSMTQGTQLLSSAVQYAEAITDVEMGGDSDEAKQMFKKRLVRKLIPSYLSDEEINEIKENIVVDANIDASDSDEGME